MQVQVRKRDLGRLRPSLHIRLAKRLVGINLCFAKLLLENGCNVLIADLALRPEAQEVVNSYSAQSNTLNRAVFQKTDVVDWEQLESMFEVAVREFGEVDIVCPGAGIYEPVRRASPDLMRWS